MFPARWMAGVNQQTRDNDVQLKVTPRKKGATAAGSESSLRIRAHSALESSSPPSPPSHLQDDCQSPARPSQAAPRSRANSSTHQSSRGSPPASPSSRVSSPASPPLMQNPYQNVPPPQRYFRNALREAQGQGQVSRSLAQRCTLVSRSVWNNFARIKNAVLTPARPSHQLVPPANAQCSGMPQLSLAAL